MNTSALFVVCLISSIVLPVGNTQPPFLPRHKSALLRLVLCVQKQFGTTFDVELWEKLVQRKNTTGLAEQHFCSTPLRSCLPPSPGKRKSSVGERYLSTLILESISLCGGVGGGVRTTTISTLEADNSPQDSTYIIIVSILIFINATGILSGLVYKYRSDCSVRSKNRQHPIDHGMGCKCQSSLDVID